MKTLLVAAAIVDPAPTPSTVLVATLLFPLPIVNPLTETSFSNDNVNAPIVTVLFPDNVPLAVYIFELTNPLGLEAR